MIITRLANFNSSGQDKIMGLVYLKFEYLHGDSLQMIDGIQLY